MKVIEARNAHTMYPEALRQLRLFGKERDSRNGPVTKFDGPCTLLYNRPEERVVFWRERDANPFFHLLESLWMLAGRNDVAYPAGIVKTMVDFSDDGRTYNGAYGYRWRHHFGRDQLFLIIDALRKNPDCRRQVLTMWDARHDLGLQSRDLPCNLQALFQVNDDGALDMMVTNRSNDLVWGALGANAVHFSVLQEFVARSLGRPVGRYWQTSFNMHLYTERHQELLTVLRDEEANPMTGKRPWNPYEIAGVRTYPLMDTTDAQCWFEDLEMWMNEGVLVGLRNSFFRRVAHPMAMAHRHWQTNRGLERYDGALEILKQVKATDWRLAAEDWIDRRRRKYLERK